MKKYLHTILLLICTGFSGYSLALDADNLQQVHRSIVDKFDQVSHIDADSLQSLAPDDLIVFDVRENEEYRVSHLKDSIQVDPDISSKEFFSLFKDQIQSKTVIFYCSVGYRSSKLAEQLLEDQSTQLESQFYNLEGGIFNWHNEQRHLIDQSGDTDSVHAYNSKWSRLINRKEKIKF